MQEKIELTREQAEWLLKRNLDMIMAPNWSREKTEKDYIEKSDAWEAMLKSIKETIATQLDTKNEECICNLDPDDTCPVKIFNENCPVHGFEEIPENAMLVDCPHCGQMYWEMDNEQN